MRPLLIGLVSLLAACHAASVDMDKDDPSDDSGDTSVVDTDGDGWVAEEDCDDSDASIHPGAEEVCNEVDDDCDEEIDEDLATTWYRDEDGDGYGAEEVLACEQPEGTAAEGGDCDDTDPAYHPGAEESDCSDPNDYNRDGSVGTVDADGDGWVACEECDDSDPDTHPTADEVCDGVDNDCDGARDEDAVDATTWYADDDGDGYGDPDSSQRACDQPRGHVADASDCDDGNSGVNPGAEEVCDGLDNDCDGTADGPDASGAPTWYEDADGDGHGDASATLEQCEQPPGYVSEGDDCDDGDPAVYPGADEYCNDADDDCDGDVDEEGAVDARAWYADADGDGYGDGYSYVKACDQPSGYVGNFKDCDDTDSEVNPKGTETCDGVDNDCEGTADWGMAVPTDHATISDALAAAADGDTICVAAGTYSETIEFGGKDVTVLGYDGAAVTTIDGGGSGPVVSFDQRESADAVLDGFTITGGDAGSGAGVYISGADPTLRNLVITANACTGSTVYCYGTGLYATNADFTLSDSEVTDNVASGTYYSGRYAYAMGVGMYLTGSDAVLTDVDVADNQQSAKSSSYQMAYGPGVYFNNSDVEWTGGTVSGNTDGTGTSYSYGYGGGLYLAGADVKLANLVIADNVLAGAYAAYGGGLYVSTYTDLEMTNVIIAHNSAGDGGSYGIGGGMYLYYYGDATLENCDVVGNVADGSRASAGGAVFAYYADLTMVNTNVVSNEATNGGALGTQAGGTTPTADITYSNFYDNGTDAFDGYSDPTGSDGNIAVDPSYTDVSAADGVDWDLTLGAGSACVDAGDPGIVDVDGTTSDIGAYGGPGGAW